MSKVKIQGNASGTGVITLTAPNTSTDRTVTLPDADVTLGTDATKLPLAGGTMTGDLVVSADVDITGSLNGTSGALDIKNEANNQNVFIKTTSAGSEVTALKIHSGGVLELPSGGLRVGGTAAANTLDDYEEGTYAGTLTPASGSLALYSGHDTLSYTKIGRMVHVQGKLTVQTNSSATGATNMNLPFTVGSFTDSADRPGCVTYGYFNAGGLNGSYTVLWEWTANTNQVRVYVKNSVSGAVNVSDYSGTGADVFVNIMYEVD
jgi:hypothetical protein